MRRFVEYRERPDVMGDSCFPVSLNANSSSVVMAGLYQCARPCALVDRIVTDIAPRPSAAQTRG
jgi:hypothetical protein